MRFLMLHGYAQNSGTFRRKLRRLEDQIRDIHPDAEFTYPDGPILLQSNDIPGYTPANSERHRNDHPGLRAWFHLRYAHDPPLGLAQSLAMLALVLEREGPFDGVIAFSQGTVIAAVLASLLMGRPRHAAYTKASRTLPNIMPYPEQYLRLQHPPFKFGILYAGRMGRTSYYDWLYESPPISTPFCHFVGKWDPMVEHEERDLVLAKLSCSAESKTIIHCGGHFVPADNKNLDLAVEYVSQILRCAATESGVRDVKALECSAISTTSSDYVTID